MLAKLLGATTVIAVDVSPEMLGAAMRLGATHVFDPVRSTWSPCNWQFWQQRTV